jgi:hypothetical protein
MYLWYWWVMYVNLSMDNKQETIDCNLKFGCIKWYYFSRYLSTNW